MCKNKNEAHWMWENIDDVCGLKSELDSDKSRSGAREERSQR
jgi:hypothetical protein